AVRTTAEALVNQLRPLASDYFGRPNVATEWRNGLFHRSDTDATVDIAALAAFAARRGETIDVTGTVEYSGMQPVSYGTHAAQVAGDAATGRVRLVDFVASGDAGRVLTPLIAHGQALGAILQGRGGTFMEHLRYDETGQLLSASLADYLVPTAPDFPAVRG